MEIRLIQDKKALPLLVESQAFEGVRRIAETVAEDIFRVTDVRPRIVTEDFLEEETFGRPVEVLLCATLGHSPLLEKMAETGVVDLSKIVGRREVFCLQPVEKPLPGVDRALLICGSDKRGTIYGMFTLSEYLGVTPFVYWGDAEPAKQSDPVLREDIRQISKEPSVRYRGFFINDEWPCFGTWAGEHFGGFHADVYQKVFEFLLRMKGNYLWPAMWTASFPLDGPGSRNEELADLYGVIIGYSHHEPCLRASEEWDKVRGEGSRYGNEWNFYTNEQGLLNYWTDSLKRSGGYENVITIGMRGERDSSMLGENATVRENVELLKDIITKQRQLIREYVNPDLSQVPQMLALYKEVEAYFYGDADTPGLKDWEGLDGVICMLCEDNFGHMRTLPAPEVRNRRGGYGMYYHLDYHGAPISYEWVDSTPLSKIWEQMGNAYEYGIRDLWIVNAGDVKFHEVPLAYFMALAYDFDRWGTSCPDSAGIFARCWEESCFPLAKKALQEKAAAVLTDYIDLNHMRRPEAQRADLYHACHYREADRILERAEAVEKRCREVYDGLPEGEKDAWYSMVHFPALASMNLLKLHLFATKNHRYATQGRPEANRLAALAKEAIKRDRDLARELGAFKGGKWNGMQLAPHIGFTRWNEDGSRYPFLCLTEPVSRPRMSVSRCDKDEVFVKNYGAPSVILVSDFLSAGCGSVSLEVANDGTGKVRYRIRPETGELPDWLKVTPQEGEVELAEEVQLCCVREKLPPDPVALRLLIEDGETTVAVDIRAAAPERRKWPAHTFLPQNGVIVMDAVHYAQKRDTDRGAFRTLAGYGRYGSGVKVFPVTADFTENEDRPELTYRFFLEKEGDYRVELLAAPTNPAVDKGALRMTVTDQNGVSRTAVFVDRTFRAGDYRDSLWCRGVLDQIRTAGVVFSFSGGMQELTVGALEAGTVLERIRIYEVSHTLSESYLGPEESWRQED